MEFWVLLQRLCLQMNHCSDLFPVPITQPHWRPQLPLCSSCHVCPNQACKCSNKNMGYAWRLKGLYRFVLKQNQCVPSPCLQNLCSIEVKMLPMCLLSDRQESNNTVFQIPQTSVSTLLNREELLEPTYHKIMFPMSGINRLTQKKSTTCFLHTGLAASFLLTNKSRISHNVFQLNTLRLHT